MVLVSYPIALVLLSGLAVIVGGDISEGAVLWGGCAVFRRHSVCGGSTPRSGQGPISVVSPLTAILVAAIPVGVGLALGERPGAIAAVGVVLALVAVVLVSREATDEDITPHRFTTKVAWLTVGSGVAFGLNFVLIAPGARGGQALAAGVRPPLGQRAGSRHRCAERQPAAADRRAAEAGRAGGVLDIGANVAMLLALQASLLSLAGVLMSLYPAATVLLAIVVLRERVTRWQAVGMVLALVAVAMIAAG